MELGEKCNKNDLNSAWRSMSPKWMIRRRSSLCAKMLSQIKVRRRSAIKIVLYTYLTSLSLSGKTELRGRLFPFAMGVFRSHDTSHQKLQNDGGLETRSQLGVSEPFQMVM